MQNETRAMLQSCQDKYDAQAAGLVEIMALFDKMEGAAIAGGKRAERAIRLCDEIVRKAVSRPLSDLRECAAALAECREAEQK